jgi:hypothetical protein
MIYRITISLRKNRRGVEGDEELQMSEFKAMPGLPPVPAITFPDRSQDRSMGRGEQFYFSSYSAQIDTPAPPSLTVSILPSTGATYGDARYSNESVSEDLELTDMKHFRVSNDMQKV